MATDTTLQQLRWRCRRGMRELDLLLSAHLERHGAGMCADELAAFSALLAATDPDLYDWFTGRGAPADAVTAALVARIRRDARAV